MTNKQVSILVGAILAHAWYGTRSSKPIPKEVAELAFQLAGQVHEWLDDLSSLRSGKAATEQAEDDDEIPF